MGQYIVNRSSLRSVAVVANLFLLSMATARGEDAVVFRPVRDVTIQLTNQSAVKGKLKRITATSVIVSLRDGSQKELSIDTVRTVKTNDNRFAYSPAQEPFEKLAVRIKGLQGATIERTGVPPGARAGDDSPKGTRPNSPPALFAAMSGFTGGGTQSAAEDFSIKNGFAGANMRPREQSPIDMDAVAFVTGLEAAANRPPSISPKPIGTAGQNLGADGEITICANPACGKRVYGAKYGDKCPYCGIVWLEHSNAEVVAAEKSVAHAGSAPTAAAGDQKGNPFASGANQVIPPPAPAVNTGAVGATTIVTSTGFDINSIPWWGKIGGFGGLIFVLWFVSQRR